MSKDLNKVMLIGRVGTDPQVKYLDNGTPVCNIRMVTSRTWKDKDGQLREKSKWTTVVFWSRLAEIAGEYVHKGSKIYIEGELEDREWDDKETGQKRSVTEVRADDLILLDSKPAAADDQDVPDAAPQRTTGRIQPQGQRPSAAPQPAAPTQPARAAKAPVREELFDADDLPF